MAYTQKNTTNSATCDDNSMLLWTLVCDRPGDTSQAMTLTEALGLPYEVKTIVPFGGTRGNKAPRYFVSASVDWSRSTKLAPPWPALIICVGQWAMRAEIWIKKRSQNHTRIVLVGRPREPDIEYLDLIVMSSQYRATRSRQLISIDFPLFRIDEVRLDAAELRWRIHLSQMPRPLTAVMVGGRTKPFRLDGNVARRIANDLKLLVPQ